MFLNNQVYLSGTLKSSLRTYPRPDSSGKLFGVIVVSVRSSTLASKETLVPVYLWPPTIIKELKHHFRKGCRVALQAEISTFGDHILLSVTRYADIELLQTIPIGEEDYKAYTPSTDDIQQAVLCEVESIKSVKHAT